MENEKSPGIDGIPIEFYKTFYKTIENGLYNSIIRLYLLKKVLQIQCTKP